MGESDALIIALRDGYFAEEFMLGSDDDADGVAGEVFAPGGETLEGDEVTGLDEGGEGALPVDTPEIDIASAGETDQTVAIARDGKTIGVEAEGEVGAVEWAGAWQFRDMFKRCSPTKVGTAFAGVHPSSADAIFMAEGLDGLFGGLLPSVLDLGEHLIVGYNAIAEELPA